MKEDHQQDLSEKPSTIYKIYVTTSNLPNGSKVGDVFVQLYGKTKNKDQHSSRRSSKSTEILSVKFPLEKSKTHKKKFKPGLTDLFEIEECYVGELEKIRVSHDSGPKSWHLKRIVIKVPEHKQKYEFSCYNWLSLDRVGKAELELMPSKEITMNDDDEDESKNDYDSDYSSENSTKSSTSDTSGKSKKPKDKKKKRIKKKTTKSKSKQGDDGSDDEKAHHTTRTKQDKIRYDIKIKTSEFSKIETGLAIDMKLVGVTDNDNFNEAIDYETKKIKLNSTASDREKDKFLANNLDLFRLEAEDVGRVSQKYI